jgi:hypothetical protein
MGRLIAGVTGAILIAHLAGAQDAPRPDGWVVLPIEDYRALRARAFPNIPDPAPPPVDAALTRVDYELRVAGDSVTGQARLTVDVLKQGWAAVLVPAGMLVRDARIDGRATALVEGTPPRLLFARAGRFLVTLDIVVPLASTAGTESIALPSSGSALSSVTLVVPRTGVALTVNGGFVAEEGESANDSRWVVYGSPGRPLTFSWKRRNDDRRAALPLRTRARIGELVALGEDATQVTANVDVEVTQGQARDVVVALPAGFIVNQVAGPTVADWDVARNEVKVSFLEPVTARTSFVITGDLRLPRDGAAAIPLVRVPSAERETGGVAVEVSGPGEIGAREPRGLEPADPSDVGEVVAGRESPSMAAFRFVPLSGTAPRSLTVSVTRYTPKAVLVANVEEARYDALAGEDGKLLVRARYAVRNNQRSFLAVALPPNAVLWSAALAGRPVRPGVAPNGGLLLPLQKGRTTEDAPTAVVELMYLQRVDTWSEKGSVRIELPAIDLPVSRTGLTLHHSPRYDLDLQPGAFRVADDAGPWTAALREQSTSVSYAPAPPPPPRDANNIKTLLDRVKNEAGRTRAGAMPISITFPEFGPSLFLAAELTPETQPPSIELQYRRTVHQSRASDASEPGERSAPAKRRASERVGESEGRSPSGEIDEKGGR